MTRPSVRWTRDDLPAYLAALGILREDLNNIDKAWRQQHLAAVRAAYSFVATTDSDLRAAAAAHSIPLNRSSIGAADRTVVAECLIRLVCVSYAFSPPYSLDAPRGLPFLFIAGLLRATRERIAGLHADEGGAKAPTIEGISQTLAHRTDRTDRRRRELL